MRRVFCAAALAAIAAGPDAFAADQAGADALQADLQGFLDDIEAAMPVRFEPADPVHVTVKGDAYLVEIAPLVAILTGRDGPLAELHLGQTDLRLVPDAADADVTAFEVLAMPAMELWTGGRLAAEVSYGAVSFSGRWSDEIDHVIAYRSRIEDLYVAVDMMGFALLPVGTASRFETTAATIESEGALSPEPAELWALRSSVRVEGLVGTFTPVMPDAQPIATERYDTLAVTTTLTGYPAGDWRDYVVEWLPALVTAAAEDRRLERDELIELITDLPAPFDGLTATSVATGVLRQGGFAAHQEQRLEIRGAALDVLDMTSHDEASGLAWRPGEGSDPAFDAVIAALMPERYSADLELRGIPLGHAVNELVDTVDAWIDDPEAGAEIFFRSFASRAATLASSGSLVFNMVWPDAELDLDASLAAGQQAALGVAGTIDGAFAGMDAVGARLLQSVPAEAARGSIPSVAAAGWTLFQALGQREGADGAVVVRYRLDIAEDGTVTFNGQDFGPVLRMFESFFAGMTGAFDENFIPDQDGGPPPAPQP